MSAAAPVLRWSPEEFIDAWEKGVFDGRHRVQLVDGEVWELGPINPWHGDAVPRIATLLRAPGARVTTRTLPMPDGGLPDPDCWVLRDGAEPIGAIRGYSRWQADDVLLVVEVADSSAGADLGPKARMYARGRVPHYWVVTPHKVYVHSEPLLGAYEDVEVLERGAEIALPYAEDVRVQVDHLIGDDR